MSTFELIAILALCGYSVYQQSQTAQVNEQGRFKMAIMYAAAGLIVGGFAVPHGAAMGFLAASAALSLVVGLARGWLTLVWVDAAGQVWRRGTPVTIGLFLAMVAVKFGLGALASIEGVRDGAGFGEILVMLAIMIAVQAEIVWRRGRALTGARESAQRTLTPTH
jgi:hypothetical protein